MVSSSQAPTPPACTASALWPPGSLWRLSAALNGYRHSRGECLATQALAERRFRVLGAAVDGRLPVALVEDGYPCWLCLTALADQGVLPAQFRPWLWPTPSIRAALPQVIAFAEAAMARPNRYLWGGAGAPHYDCSGLTQAAFASCGIWIPRDACQQERFCQPVAVRVDEFSLLQQGDLIFFGSGRRCTHVGLSLGCGRYLHCSGRAHGRDGIGLDRLDSHARDPVSVHYRAALRGAGRVVRSHDGSQLA
ncbi:MAG: NlpC/P60 family protein [Aphanocapsa feldmannii 288cV]|nr:MAG: NlpC/P60 family protein [Aphanocapsa feldmannii 288cV]